MKHDDSKPMSIITIVLAALLALVLLVGCKAKITYVPVETIKIEYKDRLRIDSLIKYDSIFQDRYMKGDTIFQIKEKYTYVDKIKIVRDSVVKDSIVQVPYPIKGDTTYIDKEFSWIDKAQIYLGRFIFLILALFIGVKYRSQIITIIKKMFFS